MTELRGRASNRLRAVAITQLMMLASLNTGYYLTQKKQVGSKMPPLRLEEKSRKRGNVK